MANNKDDKGCLEYYATMLKFKKNKKGIQAGEVVVGLAILLVSAAVILAIVNGAAKKADEKTQIDLCRVTNEVRVGTEEYSHWYLPFHSPRICNTIYKTEKELQVPTKSYKEKHKDAKNAAAAEIGDMLKNCWYAWLEGSRKEVFSKIGLFYLGGGEGCHVCYVFKVKDEASGLDFNHIQTSLSERSYFAKDSSDMCIAEGGFLIPNQRLSVNSCSNFYLREDMSDKGEWTEAPSKKADSESKKCCRKDVMDECENRGGRCLTSPNGEYIHRYDKWSCPQTDKGCYVNGNNYYSYLRYLTEYGARAGEIRYQPGDDFITQLGAISIYSGEGGTGDTYLRISSLKYAQDNKCSIT